MCLGGLVQRNQVTLRDCVAGGGGVDDFISARLPFLVCATSRLNCRRVGGGRGAAPHTSAVRMRLSLVLCAPLLGGALVAVPSSAAMGRMHGMGKRHSCASCAVEATVPAAVSLVAGMIGGSIGVGVAYPLDTLKTKQQAGFSSANPITLTRQIYATEGIAGFYSGCSTTMAGQAIIKGALFFVYGAARNFLVLRTALGLSTLSLCLAAGFSGFVGSFVMTPVERIKCVMQARAANTFVSPIACIKELLRRDGLYGLCFRGLGATVLREIPACTLYFVSFALAKAALLDSGYLARTPALMLSGAFAGAASWIPVYPIDVVKTQIQVELGEGADSNGSSSLMGTTKRLWQAGGPMAFWDGIGPKLARAVVNHAVTFLVVDFVCGLWLARRIVG